MINYTTGVFTGYSNVTVTKTSRRLVTPGRVAAVGIYAGAAAIGGAYGGLPGAGAAVLAVPEVITVPLMLM